MTQQSYDVIIRRKIELKAPRLVQPAEFHERLEYEKKIQLPFPPVYKGVVLNVGEPFEIIINDPKWDHTLNAFVLQAVEATIEVATEEEAKKIKDRYESREWKRI